MRTKGTRLSANQIQQKIFLDLVRTRMHIQFSLSCHRLQSYCVARVVYYGVSSPWFITPFVAVVNDSDCSLLRKSLVTP